MSRAVGATVEEEAILNEIFRSLEGLLDAAVTLRCYPEAARLGPDAAIRMAQQALTIATGVMVQRKRAEKP